jgi:hypothetical protein
VACGVEHESSVSEAGPVFDGSLRNHAVVIQKLLKGSGCTEDSQPTMRLNADEFRTDCDLVSFGVSTQAGDGERGEFHPSGRIPQLFPVFLATDGSVGRLASPGCQRPQIPEFDHSVLQLDGGGQWDQSRHVIGLGGQRKG